MGDGLVGGEDELVDDEADVERQVEERCHGSASPNQRGPALEAQQLQTVANVARLKLVLLPHARPTKPAAHGAGFLDSPSLNTHTRASATRFAIHARSNPALLRSLPRLHQRHA